MPTFCCLSDLHHYLPPLPLPKCDAILLGGDYGGDKDYWWLRDSFEPWLAQASQGGAIPVAAIAGNHDFILRDRPDLVRYFRWTYLQDSGMTLLGFKVWGTPWQLPFNDWAFNAPEAQLARVWKHIPSDTDILIVHGPPLGYGDFSALTNTHQGSTSLMVRIREIKPKLVVCGHIHEGYGQYKLDDTLIANVAICDQFNRPSNPITVITL